MSAGAARPRVGSGGAIAFVASLLMLACGGSLDRPAGPRPYDAGPGAPRARPTCPEGAPTCEGTGAECPGAPRAVTHAAWWARLTESPPIAWEAAAEGARHQVAIGSAPGRTDVACWTDVDDGLTHTFRSLSLESGATYFASVRTVRDGAASAAVSSEGWTVDIVAPAPPSAVIDAWVPASGEARWEAIEEDADSGFAGYRVAVGSAPGLGDVRPFVELPAGERTLDLSSLELPIGVWHHVSVQTTDVAGNRSPVVASDGFMRCPTDFVFVPADAEEGIATGAFCVAVYEMKVRGSDDGNVTFDGTQVPESRPSGTPWVNMHPSVIELACGAMGEGYAGLSNRQWQAIARSIEANADNWSGGAIGGGAVSRGHSDRMPAVALAADPSDPCFGTGNPDCTDPASADFDQRRAQRLENGGVIWDIAGNVWEGTSGSMGGPTGLWMSFDHAAFVSGARAAEFHAAFAPSGPYTHAHGMGRMYGGSSQLVRGGAYDGYSIGSAGSRGPLDVGIYAAFHNKSSFGATDGFRCTYAP